VPEIRPQVPELNPVSNEDCNALVVSPVLPVPDPAAIDVVVSQ